MGESLVDLDVKTLPEKRAKALTTGADEMTGLAYRCTTKFDDDFSCFWVKDCTDVRD